MWLIVLLVVGTIQKWLHTKVKEKRTIHPCIHFNEHVKMNDLVIKCAFCDLWLHKVCEDMTAETFKVLDIQNEETCQCF